MEWSDALKNYVAEKGFDRAFGARPLKRVIEHEVVDELAMQIIEGKIQEGDRVKIGCTQGKVEIRTEEMSVKMKDFQEPNTENSL